MKAGLRFRRAGDVLKDEALVLFKSEIVLFYAEDIKRVATITGLHHKEQ
jgi:hypothetical protein